MCREYVIDDVMDVVQMMILVLIFADFKSCNYRFDDNITDLYPL